MTTTVPSGGAPTGGGAPTEPPTSKTAYVLERLRREISDGLVSPGEPLRQADLARRFGVSPTPVREALRLLEAEGAISYSPHRGATVNELSLQRVDDLYLLRASVEGLGAGLAAERVTDESLAALRELHERMIAAPSDTDRQLLATWNRELHVLICRAGSELIADHAGWLWRVIPTRVTLWSMLDIADEFIEQHEQILTALEARDPKQASIRMEQHVHAVASYRKQWLVGL